MLLFAPPRAEAAVLLPGGSVNPDILLEAPGALLESTNITLNGVGSLTAAVIRSASGALDFYYQITNNVGSGHNLARNANATFAPEGFEVATDVFYRIDNGGLGMFSAGSLGATPLTVDRDPNGVVVGFNFTGFGQPPGTRINPGETSRILVIRTDATQYMPGLSFVINGVIAGGDTFAPAAAVPEPASLALLSSAFAAAGYLARRRKAKKDQTAQPV
jgi:hypothetical protein